jgi:hypothetical protein
MLAFRNDRFSPSGTDGSKPLSSSSESGANSGTEVGDRAASRRSICRSQPKPAAVDRVPALLLLEAVRGEFQVRLFSVTVHTTFSGAPASIAASISRVTFTEDPTSPERCEMTSSAGAGAAALAAVEALRAGPFYSDQKTPGRPNHTDERGIPSSRFVAGPFCPLDPAIPWWDGASSPTA